MIIRKSILGFFRIAIAIGIMTYILGKVPLSRVLVSFTSAHPGTVIAAISIALVTLMIVTSRLRFLAVRQGISLSTYKALGINLVPIFYGLFLPGGNLTGGAIRFIRLSGPDKKMDAALATIVYDRLDATLSLLTLGLLFWVMDRTPDFGIIGIGAVVILTGLLAFYIAIFGSCTSFSSKYLLRSLERFTRRLEMLQALTASLDHFRSLTWPTRIRIFSLSLTSQLSGILVYFLLAESLDIDISILTIGWVRSFTILATMIPVSLSGLGVREGILLVLLGAYGVSEEETLAFSFLIFGVTVLFLGLLGGLIEAKNIHQLKGPSS